MLKHHRHAGCPGRTRRRRGIIRTLPDHAPLSAAGLLSSLAGFATLIENGKSQQILARDISEGQILRVASGEKFPVDGQVIEGSSDMDLSLITGETIPVPVEPGITVYAGTINLSAPQIIRVTRKAANSLLADIARLLEKATQSQAYYVRIADKAAKYYTPVVHILALITFLMWWGIADVEWQQSLMVAITVLIITCPCALGLAVPVVQTRIEDNTPNMEDTNSPLSPHERFGHAKHIIS